MAQLNQSQMDFLSAHAIPLSKVFDASGLSAPQWKQAMKDLDMWVAYGGSPCGIAGHQLRTRNSDCVQCRPAALGYLKRYTQQGKVYVAESDSKKLIKVGMASDPAARTAQLNVYRYGGADDWKYFGSAEFAHAGKVEFEVHKALSRWQAQATYFKDGAERECRELFSTEHVDPMDAMTEIVNAGTRVGEVTIASGSENSDSNMQAVAGKLDVRERATNSLEKESGANTPNANKPAIKKRIAFDQTTGKTTITSVLSPQTLQRMSEEALKHQKQIAQVEKQRLIEDQKLVDAFYQATMAAALNRKSWVYFDQKIVSLLDLNEFTVEESRRDEARERFLKSEKDRYELNFTQAMLAAKESLPPSATRIYPNAYAKDFDALVAKCFHGESVELTVDKVIQILSKFSFLPVEAFHQSRGSIETVARAMFALEELNLKLLKVMECNREIPTDCHRAVKLTWADAVAEYGPYRVASAGKLKWVSAVWPRWEKYFNDDLEYAARSGATSRQFEFWVADDADQKFPYSVNLEGIDVPDKEDMSYEERQRFEYWQEIQEREYSSPVFVADEGYLMHVHPLPLAEILEIKGYQVSASLKHFDLDMSDEQIANTDNYQIAIGDLQGCTGGDSYLVSVKWG
ncbi:MAG: GIY-YIG nuclease family protein [Burkholderiales bacterium]|nr:GIY-YIG nuclease family protein [Burkholderiales bacterium]